MPPSLGTTSASSLPPMGENGTSNVSLNDSRQAPQKRNRTQLSCTYCRQAKLKCDRKEPCSQCVKKGKGSQCAFPVPAPRRKPAMSMQNRLNRLESLVKGAMSGQSPSESRAPGNEASLGTINQIPSQPRDLDASNSAPLDVSSGKVLVDENETTYVGATHWAAILENIEEVKSYFQDEVEEEEDEHWPTAAPSFNVESPVTKQGLFAALPSRSVVDRLVSRYFNSNSPALHIIHSPTFQNEVIKNLISAIKNLVLLPDCFTLKGHATYQYQRFWANANDVPIAWLALLYAIMVIATFSALGAGEDNVDRRGSPLEMIQSYRQCCVQSLVLSNYTRAGPYTLETLMIYMEAEFLLSKVDQVQCYLLVGNAVRLALRMGLHRDPSKVSGQITPFQGEMRRRAWHHLVQIDLLGSFHIGLPSMMQSIESDTLYPSNLRDDDLDENMIELPASRPETEFTPVSYMICKSRICDISCKIAALANSLTLPPYAEVIRLDSLLLEAYNRVPYFFQLPLSGPSVTDTPERIVKRISIELLFQKSRCMLHRKYLVKEKEAGLDASLKLLRVQALAHKAALPGGLLSRDRWFLSALSMHDFLLAAMIVYLSIIRNIETNIGANNHQATDNSFTAEQDKTVKALEESYRMWSQSASPSVEAKRASAVLKIMLKKLYLALRRSAGDSAIGQHTLDRCENHTSNLISSLSLNCNPAASASISSVLSPSNAWPAGVTSNTTPSSGQDMQTDEDLSYLPMELGEMATMPGFNWELFDNQFQPQQINDPIWPDFTEDFVGVDDDFNNYDLN